MQTTFDDASFQLRPYEKKKKNSTHDPLSKKSSNCLSYVGKCRRVTRRSIFHCLSRRGGRGRRLVTFVSGEDFLLFFTKTIELEAHESVHHSVHLNVRCCTFLGNVKRVIK